VYLLPGVRAFAGLGPLDVHEALISIGAALALLALLELVKQPMRRTAGR
jgi:hypothetical protein